MKEVAAAGVVAEHARAAEDERVVEEAATELAQVLAE